MDKRIVLVGAGSTSFGPAMLTDLFHSKVLDGSTIVLHDIKAEHFKNAWLDFAKSKELYLQWDKPNWTEKVIGKRGSSKKDSPLGNYLIEYFNALHEIKLEDLTESYKIDLVFARPRNFKISDIYGKKLPIEEFYPCSYDIIVEHENEIKTCWEEMAKLTHFRAKLKVLIIYLDDRKDNYENQQCLNTIIGNFKKIVNQANYAFPENKATEYLLIIRSREAEINKHIKWDYIIVNPNEKYQIFM